MSELFAATATIIRQLNGHEPRVHKVLVHRITEVVPEYPEAISSFFDSYEISDREKEILTHLKVQAENEIAKLKKEFPEFSDAYFGISFNCI